MLDWIEHHPGLAGWLQAVGSLLAIGVTAWVAFIPIRAETRRRRTDRADLVAAIRDAAQLASDKFSDVEAAIKARDDKRLEVAREVWRDSKASSALDQMLLLPIAGWPSPILFARTTAMRDALARVDNAIAPGMSFTARVDMKRAQGLIADFRSHESAFLQTLKDLRSD